MFIRSTLQSTSVMGAALCAILNSRDKSGTLFQNFKGDFPPTKCPLKRKGPYQFFQISHVRLDVGAKSVEILQL